MPSHVEAALEYVSKRGWPVFPLTPNGKTPMLPGGFHKATTDENQIRLWWDRWPEANIGVPCGAKTFCVVDVDPAHGGDDTITALRDEHGDLPATLVQITGSGGAHYLFRADPRVGNSTSKIGPGIDTRGNDRGYIVVAPSMHEVGTRYTWHDQSAELATIPEWLVAKLQNGHYRPIEAPETAEITFDPISGGGDRDSGLLERARAYLRECEPATQGQGGHAKLLWACTAMVHGYELSDADAYNLLASEYNPRCVPPWDLSNPKEEREFRRKITEGRKDKSKPRGWLCEELKADEAVLEHARDQANKLIQASLAKAARKKSVPAAVPASAKTPAPTPQSLPEYVMRPPGLVGDVVAHINATARKAQPLLALATSYAFCGALFGRKVRDEWDLRTNIYCLGVAESGAGKDHSRQVVKRLCAEAGVANDLLGGEEVTSDAAIATRLERTPSVLFLWDEIGHMLTNMMSRFSSGHRQGIVPYLMRLTGSARGIFLGKEYATEERKDIVQPNVCVYGTTVPSVLYEGLTTSEIRDGLLGRLLVFRSLDDDPDIDDISSRCADVPAALVQRVKDWFAFKPQPAAADGDIRQVTGAYQVTIPTSDGAQEVFHALRSDVRRRRASALCDDNPQAPLWARVEEHARRLALIMASGDCQSAYSAVVTREHAESACMLAMYCMTHFVQAVALHVADSESERHLKKIMQMVEESKSSGLTQRTITRRTQTLPKRMRDDLIATLTDGGFIVKTKLNGRGIRYYHPQYLDTK